MALDAGGKISSEFVEQLLASQAPGQCLALLRDANLLDAEGLDRLLDVADELIHSDPSKAHRLAELCAAGAEACDLPAVAARSAYTRLQTHFARGEFDAALRMARDAYDGYMACDRPLDAVRTHVGRMAVLLELGLHRDALDGDGELQLRPTTRRERGMLTALVQQNRGLSFEYMGRYEEALEAHGEA